MAIYDFKCDDCNQLYEIHMPIRDYDKHVPSHIKPCDKCKGEVRRYFLDIPNISIPNHMRATTSSKYYGVKDWHTGEMIKHNQVMKDINSKDNSDPTKPILRDLNEDI